MREGRRGGGVERAGDILWADDIFRISILVKIDLEILRECVYKESHSRNLRLPFRGSKSFKTQRTPSQT